MNICPSITISSFEWNNFVVEIDEETEDTASDAAGIRRD